MKRLTAVTLLYGAFLLVVPFFEFAVPRAIADEEELKPSNSVKLVDELITYLLKDDTNLATDEEAQKRFLTSFLRNVLNQYNIAVDAAMADRNRKVTKADNLFVLGVSEAPTTYRIISFNTTCFLAIVEVEFSWGPHAEFAGTAVRKDFVLTFESHRWQLSDIHTWPAPHYDKQRLTDDLRLPLR